MATNASAKSAGTKWRARNKLEIPKSTTISGQKSVKPTSFGKSPNSRASSPPPRLTKINPGQTPEQVCLLAMATPIAR
jgi:hypothetical protein